MEFIFTPEDARTTAERVLRYYRQRHYKVEVEESYAASAPYRTTLVARRSGMPSVLIESQASLSLIDPLIDLARWLASEREYCELYIAVDSGGSLAAGGMSECMKLGIGILITDADDIQEVRKPRNPALVITPDPNLKLGKLKKVVGDLVGRFNDGARMDAFRDLCELIERETEVLLEKLIEKGHTGLTNQQVHAMGWENQISTLASGNTYVGVHTSPLTSKDVVDLHSFRGARNLVDHRVRSQKERAQRERQLGERMMLGTRLAELLAAAQRSVN